MAWYESWKPYAFLAVIVPVIAIAYTLTQTSSMFSIVISAVAYVMCYPLTIMSIYFWATGNGKRWINGPDWSKYNDEQARTVVSRLGLCLIVMAIALQYGMILILFRLGIGILLIVLSIIMPLIFIVAICFSKKKVPDFIKKSPSSITAVILASIILVAPCCYMATTFCPTSDNVEVTIGDESFRVTAPFFDHTFRYDKVDVIELKYNFDTGGRISGNSTSALRSGTWENSEYGQYYLAIDPRNSKSISILYEDHRYVFNLPSDEKTQDLYETLRQKIGC